MDYYTLKSDMTSRENSQGEMNVCERPCGVVSGAAIVQMKVQVDLSRLRMTKWSEYGLRVLFGGTITSQGFWQNVLDRSSAACFWLSRQFSQPPPL
jgi:hypothetical protein